VIIEIDITMKEEESVKIEMIEDMRKEVIKNVRVMNIPPVRVQKNKKLNNLKEIKKKKLMNPLKNKNM